MESLDYWRLCDELSVVQAALLVVGYDPAGAQESVLVWEPQTRPHGFDAALAALKHAILAGRFKATIRRSAHARGWNEDPEDDETVGKDHNRAQIIFKVDPDWGMTTIAVSDLQDWLRGRGFKTGFFFAQETGSVDYLNPNHQNYSPKLAAAIGAWESVSQDAALTRGKSVKQAIAAWLRRNADRYGLTKEDGNPNEQGIEDVSKIANWDTRGGAPKMPGE